MRALPLIPLSLTLAACTTITPEEDPVYLKLTDLEARLMRVERVIDNDSLVQLATQLDRIETETQLLRGDIETLRFENENAGGRQRDLYVDLDARIQNLEQNQEMTAEQVRAAAAASAQAAAAANAATVAANAATEAANAPPPEPPPPIGSDQDNYNAAFDLIQSRQYPQAASAFTHFLETFPDSPLADNAQYWLAETFYVQRQFEEALPAFQGVLDDYPASAKLPDALLKIGFCNYELQRWEAAREALEQVSLQFPDTTAARLAVQRLERIAQEIG